MQHEYLTCQCRDLDHTIRLTLDDEEGDVMLEVRLNRCKSFWKRLIEAFLYVFLPMRFEKVINYHDVLLRQNDYDKIRMMLADSEEILDQKPRRK